MHVRERLSVRVPHAAFQVSYRVREANLRAISLHRHHEEVDQEVHRVALVLHLYNRIIKELTGKHYIYYTEYAPEYTCIAIYIRLGRG